MSMGGTLTADKLRELLHYDPHAGVLTWLVNLGPGRPDIGDVAGSLSKDGYWVIGIYGRVYKAHRLAWLWMKGEWPPSDIDHRNLNKSDNIWTNFRLATDSQNGANKHAPAHNTSGIKGVSWCKRSRKWLARIMVNGKSIFLGYFECLAAAHFAVIIASDKAFGEFARAF
jgi:hypothetical protein